MLFLSSQPKHLISSQHFVMYDRVREFYLTVVVLANKIYSRKNKLQVFFMFLIVMSQASLQASTYMIVRSIAFTQLCSLVMTPPKRLYILFLKGLSDMLSPSLITQIV